jgi:hypothetical protein
MTCKMNEDHEVYQLNTVRPFNFRRFSTSLPPFDLSLARYPCRRFWTRREGLNVSLRLRYPSRAVVVEKDLVAVGDKGPIRDGCCEEAIAGLRGDDVGRND